MHASCCAILISGLYMLPGADLGALLSHTMIYSLPAQPTLQDVLSPVGAHLEGQAYEVLAVHCHEQLSLASLWKAALHTAVAR